MALPTLKHARADPNGSRELMLRPGTTLKKFHRIQQSGVALNPSVMPRRLLMTLTGILLIILSVVTWQYRFVRAAADADLHTDARLRNWTVIQSDGIIRSDGTWTLLPPDEETRASVESLMPELDNMRFVRVKVEAKWDDVVRRDGKSWWSARISLAGTQTNGRYFWPEDSDMINAVGTRDWHWVECVFNLPPGLGDPHLFINNIAKSGTMQIRNLSITPVRQRKWFQAATVVVLGCWAGWIAAFFGGEKGHLRRAAAVASTLTAGWFLVFPQPTYHARPFPGGFAVGGEIPASLTVEIPPAAKPPVLTSTDKIAPPPTPAPETSKTASPEPSLELLEKKQQHHSIAHKFRQLDQEWRFGHAAAFFGVGIAIFVLAGLRHSWHLVTTLAVLSEVVPNILRQEFMPDDQVDLIANLAGVALAITASRVGTTLYNRRLERRSHA